MGQFKEMNEMNSQRVNLMMQNTKNMQAKRVQQNQQFAEAETLETRLNNTDRTLGLLIDKKADKME